MVASRAKVQTVVECVGCGHDEATCKHALLAAIPRGTFVIIKPDEEYVARLRITRSMSSDYYQPEPAPDFARVLATYLEADGRITVAIEYATGRSGSVPISRVDAVLPLAEESL